MSTPPDKTKTLRPWLSGSFVMVALGCIDDFRFENLRDIPKGFFTCLGRTAVGLQGFLCCTKTTKIRLFFAGNSLIDTSIASPYLALKF